MKDQGFGRQWARYEARRAFAGTKSRAKAILATRWFLRDLRTLRKQASEHGATLTVEPYPQLHDKTSWTGFDAHYVYQGPWAFRKLLTARPASHVDIGSFLGYLGFFSAVVPTTFIDIRPAGLQVRGLTEKSGSVLALPYSDGELESVSCMHVIEHIGLGRYGDDVDLAGSEAACRELSRVLAGGGSLYLTMPVGRSRVCFNAHRVHSVEQVLGFFSDLQLRSFDAVLDGGRWTDDCPPEALRDADYALGLFHFVKPAAALMRGTLLLRPVMWVLRATSGRVRWQRLWRRLHSESLAGRNFGQGDFRRSGELAALETLAALLPAASVVVDVGANHGGWARAARGHWPTAAIHAFEPAADTFRTLTEATADADIICVRAACSNSRGTSELHSVPGMPGLSSLHDRDLSGVDLVMTDVEEVPVTTLADYCHTNGIADIDLLKIDVEGHELSVLEGAGELVLEGRIAAIQFEFGGTNIDSRTYLRDFVRLLTPRYSLHRLLVDGLEELRYSEQEEIFVATNYLALRADLRL